MIDIIIQHLVLSPKLKLILNFVIRCRKYYSTSSIRINCEYVVLSMKIITCLCEKTIFTAKREAFFDLYGGFYRE